MAVITPIDFSSSAAEPGRSLNSILYSGGTLSDAGKSLIVFSGGSSATTLSIATDLYYNDVVLLLKAESVTITDLSLRIKSLTLNGSTQVNNSIFKYGQGSIYFPNTTSTDTSSISFTSSEVAFGLSDFTIEAWIYITSYYDNITFFTTRPDNGVGYNNAWHLGTNASRSLVFYSNETDAASPASQLGTNSWHHVAAVRTNNVLRLYADGSLVATNSSFTKNLTREICGIGGMPNAAVQAFPGYMDEIRITRSYSRYLSGSGDNTDKMVYNGTNSYALPTASFPAQGPAVGTDLDITRFAMLPYWRKIDSRQIG